MFDWLFQPFPLERSFKKKIKSAALGGVVVFLAIFLLRPFGANGYDDQFGSFCIALFSIWIGYLFYNAVRWESSIPVSSESLVEDLEAS